MSGPTIDEHLEEELEREHEDEQHAEGVQSEPLPGEGRQADQPPEMDDDDVAEMSMIAAQIESAEDFNLTFEVGHFRYSYLLWSSFLLSSTFTAFLMIQKLASPSL